MHRQPGRQPDRHLDHLRQCVGRQRLHAHRHRSVDHRRGRHHQSSNGAQTINCPVALRTSQRWAVGAGGLNVNGSDQPGKRRRRQPAAGGRDGKHHAQRGPCRQHGQLRHRRRRNRHAGQLRQQLRRPDVYQRRHAPAGRRRCIARRLQCHHQRRNARPGRQFGLGRHGDAAKRRPCRRQPFRDGVPRRQRRHQRESGRRLPGKEHFRHPHPQRCQ